MDNVHKTLICLFFVLIFGVNDCSAGNRIYQKHSDQLPYPLNPLVDLLFEPKTFGKNLAEIDGVLRKHCEAKFVRQEGNQSTGRYECLGKDLVVVVDLSLSVRSFQRPVVMFLDATFPIRLYDPVANILIKRLGKPKNRWADTTRWVYDKDSELNKEGTPVFIVKRDFATSTAFVSLALEQGP